MRGLVVVLPALLSGCLQAPGKTRLVVSAPSEIEPALTDYVAFLDRDDVSLRIGPPGACTPGTIELDYDAERGECYRIASDDGCTRVTGGLLGLQYGLTDVLERTGFGFFHPHAIVGPDDPTVPPGISTDWSCPEMARRGIHMHTIHPIEGYFDAWDSQGDTTNMRRIGDWVIKNRGNHLQWVALESTPDGWEADTAAIVQALQARGLTTGLGIQLFSEANLQQAMNLVPDSNAENRSQMERQWAKVSGLGFDLFNLSFGEFFSAEPESFIDTINESYAILQEQAPGTEMTTVLHVGDEQRIEYQGTDWIYYNLAQFADPQIKPWVHTVMYYNLFDDAGGAYHHAEFDQHRGIIEDYLSEGRPIGYFPESAYWCAFDNPIPQYLPIYIQSRWKDLDRLTGLDDHVLFSSGWEWGYWLHDAATLRMNWKVPADPCSPIREILAPLEEPSLAQAICDLADVQYKAMIEDRLAPWTAGFDAVMETGKNVGIVAQPERTGWDELTVSDEGIATALEQLADATEAIGATLPDSDSPWVSEVADGFAINTVRARFMARLIEASIHRDEAALMAAEQLRGEAETIVNRRHSQLHDPDPERLLVAQDNHTFYDYGYLRWSNELCFYTRELTQVENLLRNESASVPSCIF